MKEPTSKAASVLGLAVAFALGTLTSFVALLMAVAVFGPIVRSALGEPADFGQDYSTSGAFAQATAVRLASLTVCFGLVGLLGFRARGGSASPGWALAVANPVTVFSGYLAYQHLFSGRYTADYFGYLGGVVLALAAPIVLVSCVLWGSRRLAASQPYARKKRGGRL